MSIKMSTGKKILFLIALFLGNVTAMADMVIIPVVPNFYTDFGDKINLVNFIVSGPMLIMVISSLLMAKFMKLLSKKTLLIIGLAVFSVCEIFCVSVYNVYFIAVMRAIGGFAIGMFGVASLALIAEIFTDEKQRSTMLGINNGIMAAIGVGLGMLAGLVAGQAIAKDPTAWKVVFNIYWIAIPILLLTIFFVPNTGKEKALSSDDAVGKKGKFNFKTFIPLNLSFFIFNAVYCIVYFQIGLYVTENNIGDATTIGILSSLGTVGSFVTSILFGLIYSKLKRGTIIPVYLLIGLSFTVLYAFPVLPVAIVTCIIMGAAYGAGLSYFFMRPTVIVPPSKMSTTMSIVTAINGIGTFAATYLTTALQGIMGVTTVTAIMPVLAGICGLGTIAAIILTLRNRKHPSEYQANEAVGS